MDLSGKDLYKILDIPKSASADEIKSAFRTQAKKFHPDIYQGDKQEAEEKFKEIGAAYKILSDPEKRKIYDTYGYEGLKGAGGFGGQGFGGFQDFGMEDIFGDLSDVLGDFFGFGGGSRGRSGSRRRRGGDLRHDVTLEFEEAAFGKKETIEVTRHETCPTCKGEGIKPGTKKKVCNTCGGHGKVRQSQGFFSMVTTCPDCGGAGEKAEALCPECGGARLTEKERKIEINIPAGVSDNSYLKLNGEGDTGINGGGSGDLYVVVRVKGHEIYARQGDNVVLELPITLGQAVLGDDVTVPTLYGDTKISIPAGIQHGETIVIKGKGFPRAGSSGKGDMYVTVAVEVPKNINSKLKDAFKNVRVLENDNACDAYQQFKKYHKKSKKFTDKGDKHG